MLHFRSLIVIIKISEVLVQLVKNLVASSILPCLGIPLMSMLTLGVGIIQTLSFLKFREALNNSINGISLLLKHLLCHTLRLVLLLLLIVGELIGLLLPRGSVLDLVDVTRLEPSDDNKTSLLLLGSEFVLTVLILNVFRSLNPLGLDLLIEIRRQLIIDVVLLELSLDKCLKDIDKVDLMLLVDFDLETLKQSQSLSLFQHNSFVIVDYISLLLSSDLLIFIIFKVLILLNKGARLTKWWLEFIKEENELFGRDPAGISSVILLPQLNHVVDIITLHDTHILLLCSVETLNDCSN